MLKMTTATSQKPVQRRTSRAISVNTLCNLVARGNASVGQRFRVKDSTYAGSLHDEVLYFISADKSCAKTIVIPNTDEQVAEVKYFVQGRYSHFANSHKKGTRQYHNLIDNSQTGVNK